MKIFSPIFRKRARSGVAGMRNTSGFTLLELMVVMVMGAIVMAIAISALQNLVKDKPADELVSTLHLARMMAIRQHREINANIDPVTNQCTLQWTNDDDSTGNKVWQLTDSGDGYFFNTAPPGTPPNPYFSLNFSALGFISSNAFPTLVAGNIYLTDGNNSRHFRIRTTIAGGIDLDHWEPGPNGWVSAY